MHINIAEKLINSTLFEACGKIIFELINNPENLYNSEIFFFIIIKGFQYWPMEMETVFRFYSSYYTNFEKGFLFWANKSFFVTLIDNLD